MRKRWLQVLHRIAPSDPRIVFIGSDLSADPAMKKFQADLGGRFFMEGVSEAHMVGMASGLAMNGHIVYANTIATFITRRCYEQNVIDLGMANVRVRLLAGGGGLVYAPLGPTHLALDDLAIMRAIPNFSVVVPADADEIERAVLATVDHPGPIYFRVAKGGEPQVSRADLGFALGRGVVYREPGKAAILTTGPMLATALAASEALDAAGLPTGVVHFPTVKPLDRDLVIGLASRVPHLFCLEEHSLIGGLGSAVAEVLAELDTPARPGFRRLAIPDEFPMDYGSQDSLLAGYGLDRDGVVRSVLERVRP
jgi:transketolase